jgi:hypothetical protein
MSIGAQSMTQPYPQAEHPYSPPPVKRRRRKWPWVIGGLLLLLVISANSGSDSGQPATSASPQPTATAEAKPAAAANTPAVVAPKPAPAAPAPLDKAKAINARTWQLIAKDPEAHAGERVIVYGQVTQFDAATGTDNFRANVDGVVHKPEYGYADYETNTLLSGDEGTLKDVVEGDLFKAEVTVDGAKSYDTAIGGNTTAPQLTVTKIEVIGHLD